MGQIEILLKDYLESQEIETVWLHYHTGIRYATLLSYIHNKSGSIRFKHLAKIMEVLNITDMNVILGKRDNFYN